MTRIGGNPPADFHIDRTEPAARQDRRADQYKDQLSGYLGAGKDAASSGDMRFGEFNLQQGLSDPREHRFLERLGQAMGKDEAGDGASETAGRLIAVAGPVPLPAASGDTSELAPAGRTTQVDAMIDRIEQALKAAPRDVTESGVRLSLDLGEAGGIFTNLSITMTATTVDVVLTRDGGAVTDQYFQAAQMLADRLHARLARRTVRVLEIDARETPVAAGGMDEISRLLAPRKADT